MANNLRPDRAWSLRIENHSFDFEIKNNYVYISDKSNEKNFSEDVNLIEDIVTGVIGAVNLEAYLVNLVSNSSTTDLTGVETRLDDLLTELEFKADLTQTQPVSMASPPSGASTETKQNLTNTKLDTLNAKDFSTSAKQDSVISDLAIIKGYIDGVEGSLTSIDGKVLTNTQLRATPIDVKPPTTETATTSQVTATTIVGTVLSANANRKKFIIWNIGNATVYLKFGSGATLTDYTIPIEKDSGWEESTYTGIVTGITSSGTGGLKITEL